MKGISGFGLKWIAIITMLIDHIGAILFPQYRILRVIGRISFPIFCFLLVEGFHHTHDWKKYAQRLFLFALVSEIPFDLAFFGTWYAPVYQNVFWTLALGIVMLGILEQLDENWRPGARNGVQKIAILIGFLLLSDIMRTDYAEKGLLMILIFYAFYDNRLLAALFVGGFNVLLGGVAPHSIQWAAVLSVFPILWYNGTRGKQMKYFFYLFYPVHLLILCAVAAVL